MRTPLRVQRQGRLVEATLCRPPVNALDGSGYDALRVTFEQARADEVILLSGEGLYFSAGQDLAEFNPVLASTELRTIIERGAAAVASAMRCRAPIVVAVHGAAIGGGCLLACAADIAVLADDAWLQLPELRVGMTMGYSVASRLLTPALARRMLLTGERVMVSDLGAGSGARVVAAQDAGPIARATAEELLALPADLVALARSTWGADERERVARAYEVETRLLLDARF